jgi:hypothetical protein
MALVAELQRRDRESTVLNHMTDLLQACNTQEEAYHVIAMEAAGLSPGRAAASRSAGVGSVSRDGRAWGDEAAVEVGFPWMIAGRCGAGSS